MNRNPQEQESQRISELMGWDDFAANTTMTKIGRMVPGLSLIEAYRSKNNILPLIYAAYEDVKQMPALIKKAQKDKVYDRSTYNKALIVVQQTMTRYGTPDKKLGDKEQAHLLFNILAKCNTYSNMNAVDIADMYFAVTGLNADIYSMLFAAYHKDEQKLSAWKEIVGKCNIPHDSYTEQPSPTSKYWTMLSDNMICPFNFLRSLVTKLNTLSMPSNHELLQDAGESVAAAYFPSIINQRKGFNPTKPEKYVGQEITIEEASVLSFDVTGGVGGAKKAGNVKPTRRKFVCGKCGMSAQAKQSAKLKCGECDEVML